MAACLIGAAPAVANACTIDNPQKIGVGAWPVYGPTRLDADLTSMQTPWYYDWMPTPSSARAGHVPMIWSEQYINFASTAAGNTLLTFNEPDHPGQSNMSVAQAISYWPMLMASGKRLSSPAVTTGNEIGSNRWLTNFMAEANRLNYRVDFIAVHYYTKNTNIYAFKRYLQNIYNAYKRPIWVTEWALVDWSNPSRYSESEQRVFFARSTEMMDDLPFVERQAWFALYDGLDGWDISSGLVEAGQETPVGEIFANKVSC